MRSETAKPHRRSIRLRHHDYAQAGAYFVTLVAHHRALLFGEIAGGTNHLTAGGRIVQRTWDDLPKHHSGVQCDAFVVMPNHVHGIIQLIDPCVGADATGAWLR
jgi:REP element-mobilizing transposase RayT